MASMRVQTTVVLAVVLSFIAESLSSEVVSQGIYGVPAQEASVSSRAPYAYAYEVQDPDTGAYSGKQEASDGKVVYGSYIIRTEGGRTAIYYSADPIEVQDKAQPIQLQIPFPVALPVVHTYVAPPPPPPPPQPLLAHQVQFGTPVAIPLAPAILARTSSKSDQAASAPRSYTSFSSPTHSYSYSF